jgi:hypothetical protein
VLLLQKLLVLLGLLLLLVEVVLLGDARSGR